jgi:hypothetical protein
MSVIRVGSTGTYADGWEQIFGGTAAGGRRGKPGPKQAKPKGKAKQASSKQAPSKQAAASKAGKKKAKSRGR